MAGSGEMDSDLMGAAGHESAAHDREVVIEKCQNLDTGARGLAAFSDLEAPSMVSIAGDGVVDGEGIGLGVTLDHGQVETLDPAIAPAARELRQRFR